MTKNKLTSQCDRPYNHVALHWNGLLLPVLCVVESTCNAPTHTSTRAWEPYVRAALDVDDTSPLKVTGSWTQLPPLDRQPVLKAVANHCKQDKGVAHAGSERRPKTTRHWGGTYEFKLQGRHSTLVGAKVETVNRLSRIKQFTVHSSHSTVQVFAKKVSANSVQNVSVSTVHL